MKFSSSIILSSSIAVALFFGGCSFAPDYVRPEMDLPQVYNEPAVSGTTIANLPWWEFFADSTLQELIKISLAENKDLKVAAARIIEARALLGITRADQFPSVDLNGNANRRDISDKILAFDFKPGNDFGLSGDAFFELDIWGRLRNATEADRARLLSTEYAYHALHLSLVSSVAQSYFSILDLENRLQIARRTTTNRTDATKLIRTRFKGGIVPELDVNQAEIEETSTVASAAELERELSIVTNALNVLLGRTPRSIRMGKPLPEQHFLATLPVEFPAQLVERRPDILAAQESVKAATAEVGVAIAERFPSLSLTGFIGLESRDSDDLFSSDARTWGVGGNLLGPIIDFGKRRSNVEAAEARVEQEYKNYEQVVLRAVQEVEDALVAIRTYKIEHDAYTSQRKAAANAARLSRARYDDGIVQYLEVLDTERSLFSAELSESITLQRYLNSIVRLYKALGGGWEPEASQS